MHRVLRLWLVLACLALPATAQEKPFKRALVLTGGGFRFLYFIGMYDALTDQGWQPDVIITTCGASIAGALIHGIPDRYQRLAAIQSPELLAELRGFRLTKGGFRDVQTLLRKLSRYQTGWQTGSDVIPDLFNLAFFDIDSITLPFWQRSFGDRQPKQPHFIMVGATAAFGPKDAEQPRHGRKLYREAYFTDTVVAPYLRGLTSAVAQRYPLSAVGSETSVFTDVSVGDAASISIRDPFLFKPIQRGSQYFTGANVNLYPLEMARQLADEVMLTFNPAFNGFETMAIGVSLGYDMNSRLRQVTNETVDYWLDATDMRVNQFAMDPKVTYGFPTLFYLRRNYPEDRPLPRLAPGVLAGAPYVIPAEAEFVRRALVAYDRGYERGLEAVSQRTVPGPAHVRGKNQRNFYGYSIAR